MNSISPSQSSWEIYKKLVDGAKVHVVAEQYNLKQEDVIRIFFQCNEYRLQQQPQQHTPKRRRYANL